MRWLAFPVAFGLFLSGCASDAPEAPAADPGPIATARPEFRVVLDVNESYTNPVPPRAPGIDNNAWTVAEFTLPDGYTNLTLDWTRIADSPRVKST